LAEAVINFIVSVALASWLGVWALVVGTLTGTMTYLVLSYLLAPHRPRLSLDWPTIRPLIRFGRWVFVTGLVVMIGNYVLRLVISRQLGTAELGLYFLAAQLAFLPAEAASEIVGTVAFPLFARLQLDRQQAAQTFRTVFTALSMLLFPVCALLIVLAPTLVQSVLGGRWEGTVPVIRVLALVSMIGILGEVTGPIFNGFGHPAKVTLIEVVQSSSIILLVWGLTTRFGLVGAALAWLPTAVISQLVSILLIRQLLPRPFARLAVPLLVITAVTGAAALIAFIIDNLAPNLAGLILAISLSIAAFAGLLWFADRRFSLGFAADLYRMFPQVASLLNHSQRIASRI
jgi:O-antigen/teichoic acid export membrane protein